jgi:hypothetical protein
LAPVRTKKVALSKKKMGGVHFPNILAFFSKTENNLAGREDGLSLLEITYRERGVWKLPKYFHHDVLCHLVISLISNKCKMFL